MALLSITNTFSPGTVIASAQTNQNFTDIINWANGNITNVNIGTMNGPLTWGITTNVLAESITTTSTAGAVQIVQNGNLSAAMAGLNVTSSVAQSSGAALMQ